MEPPIADDQATHPAGENDEATHAMPQIPRRAGGLDPLERVGLVFFAFVLIGLIFIVPVVFQILGDQRHAAADKRKAAAATQQEVGRKK